MQKRKTSNLTIFAILTTITLLTWVAIEVYQRLNKIDLTSIPQEVLTPLNPNLDTQILDSIEKRRSFSDDEVSQFSPGSAPQVGATPKPSESTPSAQQ